MAFSAHQNPEAVIEHFDTEEALAEAAKKMAKLIKKAHHFIVFTGAGISTSCGIPDYRGPDGVWTLQAKGEKRTKPTTSTLCAVPSQTHMALIALQEAGYLKHIISQNTDGLHRRSGIHPDLISELHGNSNLERCVACGKEYLRDFYASGHKRTSLSDHRTGRQCKCGGDLIDTIIHFGESLPDGPLNNGFDHAEKADVCLVLGSSLTVSPANSMPKRVATREQDLVIVNLQHTPLDNHCTLRVHSKCDDFMTRVMQHLGLTIPTFKLKRRVHLIRGSDSLKVRGIDVNDGTPASIFSKVVLNVDGDLDLQMEEPFRFGELKTGNMTLELSFMGHYNEPRLDIPLIWTGEKAREKYLLTYDPMTGYWQHEKEGEDADMDTTLD